MGDLCDLRAANGEPDILCDAEECPFWRVVEHVSAGEGTGSGCAVKHFRLLGNDGLAEWLLSVKERIERSEGGQ